MTLRACLGVVFAEEGIVCGDETDNTLLTLVANVDTNKHGLGRNILAEAHSPEIATELGIDLTDDVEEDSVVVSSNGLAGHELGDDWVVAVDLVLNSSVELLLTEGVRDDHQEELDCWCGIFLSRTCTRLLFALRSINVILEVGVDSVFEVFNARSVVKGNDISVVDEDVKAEGLRQFVELVLKIFTIFDILLKAENGPLLEVYWLANDLSQNICIFEALRSGR